MVAIKKLSYWEKSLYFNDLDFLIIGAGIVGYSTALSLRDQYPTAKILLLERGYLPTGASTKNAGFACFGSPTELMDDLTKMSENELKNLIHRRYSGLQLLLERCGKEYIDYQNLGSYELFRKSDNQLFQSCEEQLHQLNALVEESIGISNVYQPVENRFGFHDIHGIIENKAEGQINTGKMMQRLHQLCVSQNIACLFDVEIVSWEKQGGTVLVDTRHGEITTNNLIICTNGLSQQLLPDLDVQPARAQVLITKPISNLPFKGTFHYDAGYYYFRNIDNRVLLGGGRNLDVKGETTTELEQTARIQKALHHLLKDVILPSTPFEVDYAWSGIMGVGATKSPIVKKLDTNIACGIRLGGMGVALGSLVGKELSALF
jgi:glycine/D-amino acid oxidase-like deaminating enzyme